MLIQVHDMTWFPWCVVCSIFGSLEALLARQFSSNRPGQRNDWQELEGCWVLRPPGNWV
jgi:hypothetical protein